MTGIHLQSPWLRFDLGVPMQVLSWSVNRPGFVQARDILWRHVHNADLPRDMDIEAWVARVMADGPAPKAVLMLTSRTISTYQTRTVRVGQAEAQAVATVGLSNGERVGRRVDYSARDWGTINVAVRLNAALTQPALLEAMSIAVQARTAAVIDAGVVLISGDIATGTGTDCIAVAAPMGDTPYAGLHTEIGEAIGRAVFDAVSAGAHDWKVEQEDRQDA